MMLSMTTDQSTRGRVVIAGYARHMRRHPKLLAFGIVTLLIGTGMTATDNGVVVVVIGLIILGIGGVTLMSLAFLAVGESEDRDRERNPGG